MKHLCHARYCERECKPEKLMCFQHWALVPVHIQRAVVKHYRAGQCDEPDARPTKEWFDAARAAIKAVSAAESRVPPEQTSMFPGFGEPTDPEKKGSLH